MPFVSPAVTVGAKCDLEAFAKMEVVLPHILSVQLSSPMMIKSRVVADQLWCVMQRGPNAVPTIFTSSPTTMLLRVVADQNWTMILRKWKRYPRCFTSSSTVTPHYAAADTVADTLVQGMRNRLGWSVCGAKHMQALNSYYPIGDSGQRKRNP